MKDFPRLARVVRSLPSVWGCASSAHGHVSSLLHGLVREKEEKRGEREREEKEEGEGVIIDQQRG